MCLPIKAGLRWEAAPLPTFLMVFPLDNGLDAGCRLRTGLSSGEILSALLVLLFRCICVHPFCSCEVYCKTLVCVTLPNPIDVRSANI